MAVVELIVVPRASEDRMGPYVDGTLRVRVTKPPVGGEANRAVVRLVAAALGTSAGRVEILTGSSGRRKRLRIDGMEASELARRLGDLAPH